MKTILLSLILTTSALYASAQVVQDTTSAKDGAALTTPPKGKTYPHQYHENVVEIKAADVPPTVRTTLQDRAYKGWENSTIYHDKTQSHYTVEMNNGKTKNTYRFDKDGKPLKNNTAPAPQ